MSEIQSDTQSQTPAVEPYPSFPALRDAHAELLKSEREMADHQAFLDRVEEFCERAQATGTLLDLDDDRRASQSLLNYWVTTLYAAERFPSKTILADFDSSRIPRIEDSACPYPGLRAFREEDAKNFFGRQGAVDYILNRLKVDRLLALVGPAGRGKTSLVRAGVLPKLKTGDTLGDKKRFYFPVVVPGSDPLRTLARIVKGFTDDNSGSLEDEVKNFQRNPDYLLQVIKGITNLPVVIVVDQFEDLFNLCRKQRLRQTFVNNLLSVIEDAAAEHIVILTMRDDDYSTEIKRLGGKFRERLEPARWTLQSQGAAEIYDAIEKPAEMVGLKLNEQTIMALSKEIVAEPVGLPLLQFALQKLWAKRDLNTIPDRVYFEELRSCRIAFVRTADDLYDELKPDEKLTARRVLMQMVSIDHEGKVNDVPISRTALLRVDKRERVEHVLHQAVQEGLVRLSENEQPADVQVELTHNSLIGSWKEMVAWVGARKSTQRLFKYASRSMLALLFFAAILGAWYLLTTSIHNKRTLLSHRIARQSEQLLNNNRLDLAMLIGLDSYLTDNNVESRGSIINLLQFSPRPIKFLYKEENYTVADLALSADKKKLASLDDDGNISIWYLDVEPTKEVVLPSKGRASYPLVFSPDGQTLASASSIPGKGKLDPDPSSNITLWNISTGTARNLFVGSSYNVRSIAFAPNGSTLISGGKTGEVFRWDLKTNTPDQKPFITFGDWVTSVNFDPGGTMIACGSRDGTVALWDVNKWQRIRIPGKVGEAPGQVTPIRHPGVSTVLFSPDGTKLAIDHIQDTVIWNIATGKEEGRFVNDTPDQALISAFCADGRTLVSYSPDGTVFVWDLVNNKRTGERLYNSVDPSRFVGFSYDAEILALSNGTGITLWNIPSSRPLVGPLLGYNDEINTLAFDPTHDGKTLAAGLKNGRVVLWDTATRSQIDKLDTQSQSAVTSVAFSHDGQTLAAGLYNGTLQLWKMNDRRQLGDPLRGPEGSSVISLAFSGDGKTLAAIVHLPSQDQAVNANHDDSKTHAQPLNSGALVLWNVESRNADVWTESGDNVTAIAFGSDNQTLIAAHSDGKIESWDVASHRAMNLQTQDTAIVSLSFDAGGKRLALGNRAGTIKIWDLNDLPRTNQVGIFASSGALSQLSFSPDGMTIGTLSNAPESPRQTGGAESSLQLWDLETSRRMGSPTAGISSFAFRSDGKMVATDSPDLTIILWDIDSGLAEEKFCRIAGANPSREDWNTFVGEDTKYCRICSNLPSGKEAPSNAAACKSRGWLSWW